MVTNIGGSCCGLFIDINNTLYCSITNYHQVMILLLDNGMNISEIRAGNGTTGSTMTTLRYPHGLYVDGSFTLYVADSGNDRIQYFSSGQLVGTTVVINGIEGPISLLYPTGIVMDAKGYLFIVDSGNDQIIGSGPDGFRCVVGCSDSSSSQLTNPQSMSFDSYGNIYITDRNNNRIQQFTLSNNLCGNFSSKNE